MDSRNQARTADVMVDVAQELERRLRQVAGSRPAFARKLDTVMDTPGK